MERDPWHFARPKLADAYLDAFDLKLSSARGMFARRRMGKTEFLRMDLLPNAAARGYLVAYTNLWDNRAALERTRATVFSDEHFKKQWDELSLTDQAVVAMLAVGESDFHAAAVLERLTGSLGKPVTKNTMAHALRRLQTINIVTKLAYGEYHIEDEAYAEWVRRRGRK